MGDSSGSGGGSQFSFYCEGTFSTTYGKTWGDACAENLTSASHRTLGYCYYNYSRNIKISGTTKVVTAFGSSGYSSSPVYATASSEDISGVWVGPSGLSGEVALTDKIINGKIYYAKTYVKTS